MNHFELCERGFQRNGASHSLEFLTLVLHIRRGERGG